jgi:hypothetical protein
MPAKSKSAAADGNPFRRVLAPIEERLDALDAAIRDIHPFYSQRALDRMAYLEEHCREHANRVLGVVFNQKADLVLQVEKANEAVCDLERKTSNAIKLLEEATQRHQADAKVVRCELGQLKAIIDSQSERLVEERRQSLRAVVGRRPRACGGFGGQGCGASEPAASEFSCRSKSFDESRPEGDFRRRSAVNHADGSIHGHFAQPIENGVESILPCTQCCLRICWRQCCLGACC